MSLGNLGWIQIANFMVTGLLVIVSAIGMRRVGSVTQRGIRGMRWELPRR
jgi:hypothetical protein